MSRRLSVLVPILLAVGMSGCVVQYKYLKSGYGDDPKQVIKRIALMVEPKAAPVPGLERVLFALTQEFLAVEKSYIVLPTPSAEQNRGGLQALCGLSPKPQGVLKSELRRLNKQADGILVGLRVVLLDCNGNRIWDAYGEDVLDVGADVRPALTRGYSVRYGEKTKPYIVPLYEILKQVLSSLPSPRLDSSEQRERIRYFRRNEPSKSADS